MRSLSPVVEGIPSRSSFPGKFSQDVDRDSEARDFNDCEAGEFDLEFDYHARGRGKLFDRVIFLGYRNADLAISGSESLPWQSLRHSNAAPRIPGEN